MPLLLLLLPLLLLAVRPQGAPITCRKLACAWVYWVGVAG